MNRPADPWTTGIVLFTFEYVPADPLLTNSLVPLITSREFPDALLVRPTELVV